MLITLIFMILEIVRVVKNQNIRTECEAISPVVGPVQYCYPNEGQNTKLTTDQPQTVNLDAQGQESYPNQDTYIYNPPQNTFALGESSTANLPDYHNRPPVYSGTPGHHLTSKSPNTAEQLNPITRNQLSIDLNEPPVQSPEEFRNILNISVQPSAQTYATSQRFNFDLNYEPTDYQD